MKTHLKNIISEAEAALAKLEDPTPSLKIIPVREGVVRAEWDPALAELPDFDLWYYNKGNHRPWQLNIRMHVPDADLSQGYWEIPLNFEGVWLFQAKAEGYKSDVIEYTYKKKVNPIPSTEAKKITIIESQRGDGNFFANVNGVIPVAGKWRVYFSNRGTGKLSYVETTDFENFSRAVETTIDTGIFMYDDRGTIRGYRKGEGDSLDLYDRFDPMKGFQRRERKAYDWRIDGQVNMGFHNGQYLSTGRVRGERTKQTGGWADDWPAYPDKRDYPDIVEAFPSYWDANDFLRDRRGISLHTSPDRRSWNNRILSDPVDYPQFEAFAGWTDKGADGIGDFYASTYMSDGKLLIKAYMKQKSRLVDRFDNPDHDDRDVRRRWRFTGETIIIPGVVQGNTLKIVSDKSIIPREFHDRKTPSGVSWATKPNAVEWGQSSPANTIIRHKGNVYIFYGYRDDVHYEALPDRFNTVPSGIYVCKMSEKEFDSHFE